jgi:hypothetical protein
MIAASFDSAMSELGPPLANHLGALASLNAWEMLATQCQQNKQLSKRAQKTISQVHRRPTPCTQRQFLRHYKWPNIGITAALSKPSHGPVINHASASLPLPKIGKQSDGNDLVGFKRALTSFTISSERHQQRVGQAISQDTPSRRANDWISIYRNRFNA